jgi:hypothetical protein
MDPIGCISFIIDNVERIKKPLHRCVSLLGCSVPCPMSCQLEGNSESIARQTKDLAIALADLEDVLQELAGKGSAALPAGLDTDLERFKDRYAAIRMTTELTIPPHSLSHSTEELLLLQPLFTNRTNRWRRLLLKIRMARNAERVASHLARIDQDVQALSNRFAVRLFGGTRSGLIPCRPNGRP